MTEQEQKIERLENDVALLMKATFKAYKLTGADTDGDEKWYCSPEWAGVSLLDAVIRLREDYDEALREIGQIEKESINRLNVAVEFGEACKRADERIVELEKEIMTLKEMLNDPEP